MNTVKIIKGTHYGNEISGEFELLKTKFNTPEHKKHLGDGRLVVMMDGAPKSIWVNEGDYEIQGNPNFSSSLNRMVPEIIRETPEEMRARINKRFRVMDVMSRGVISGKIRSLIISGAAGIGKTFTLNRDLTQANDAGKINYSIVNGKMSPIGLYCKLYECSGKNDVLVLDDVDVFSSEDSLNVLKAALDTSETRKVCWSTAASFLEEKGVPNEFEFEGTVVFITNVDMDREIERGSKLSPHMMALISRSVYLDLGVHSNEEIMIRVEDVIRNTDMMFRAGLMENETEEVLTWMKDNVNRLRNVSLRTALHLAEFVLTDADEWMELAEVTQLR